MHKKLARYETGCEYLKWTVQKPRPDFFSSTVHFYLNCFKKFLSIMADVSDQRANILILPVRKFLILRYFMMQLATVCNYSIINVNSAQIKCQIQLNNRQCMFSRPSLHQYIIPYNYNHINISL